MSKPLARSKDDKDLDAMLKDQERADDPMLAFIKKRKTKDNGKKGKYIIPLCIWRVHVMKYPEQDVFVKHKCPR